MNHNGKQFNSPDIYRKGNVEDTLALAKRAGEQRDAISKDELDTYFTTGSYDRAGYTKHYRDSGKQGGALPGFPVGGSYGAQPGAELSVSGAALAKAQQPKSARY
ncbi:hypothetical protein UFOVP965_118 [uncultured Caudovirales phage]|uniref:Uncharacterized protein n=1 Tax=uncultured Caudovirales phage TaxID=2100421 RepID=A0A6J5R1Y3_9CAUD|nr:hypothetical protein UFOVP965_118 [uncultured Caudovirales phage]CAB4179907.1 hypothetical protein UFOVP1035_114 [uncultured Caudovirales phage]CAB4188736.1 hypothetical protein UFOVP1181_73 [uncultured Caudovirales phage]